MTTTPYYVSTLARYVVVDATDDVEAKVLGEAALYDLYADVRARTGKDSSIVIQIVRPATPDEIAMCALHAANVAREFKA